MSRLAVLAWFAFVGAAPRVAHASCFGEERPRWAAHQQLVGLLNPNGLEHSIRVGLCVPLYASTSRALTENYFEAGLTSYVSPVYAYEGAYAQLSPVSFFALRAELTGVGIWPIPLATAGYYPVAGYASLYRNTDLPAGHGGSATGWNTRLSAITRAAVPIGDVRLIVYDALWGDYSEIGDAPYFFQMRANVISARADWVVGNEAFLMVGIPVRSDLELRLGAYDSLRDVPASGYVGNQLGGVAMLAWTHPYPGIQELDVFLRVGLWTNHAFREDEATALAGATADHDLGGL